MVAAKSDAAHVGLSRQFAAHSIERVYHSFVRGLPGANSGCVDQPIGRHPRDRKRMSVASRSGRESVTAWRVLRRYPRATVSELEIRPETGRTHQIRVHLSSIGLPLVGDEIYGRARGRDARLGRPALHASRLGFEHPIRRERLCFETTYPQDLDELARSLGPSEPADAVGPAAEADR
jgi:23S rRNA pseudouridine1911/1915/1917 synthase